MNSATAAFPHQDSTFSAAPETTEARQRRRDDLTFARRVAEGWPEEIERFLNEFRPTVLHYITKLSWDARSREEAMNAVNDVFSECFGGFAGNGKNAKGKRRVPLLQRYKGHGSLEGWLKRSARNRFYSALRRSEYRQRAASIEPEAEWFDATPTESRKGAPTTSSTVTAAADVPREEQERIRKAIAGAFESLSQTDSQALIFLRLHFLEKVKKQRIAEAWQQHPATVGRRITAGLEHLRTEITRRLPDYADGGCPSSAATESLILLCRDLLDSQLS